MIIEHPIHARYGGHQFGHWASQLGDGRAHLLGAFVVVISVVFVNHVVGNVVVVHALHPLHHHDHHHYDHQASSPTAWARGGSCS